VGGTYTGVIRSSPVQKQQLRRCLAHCQLVLVILTKLQIFFVVLLSLSRNILQKDHDPYYVPLPFLSNCSDCTVMREIPY
jgi:hypothetical protein